MEKLLQHLRFLFWRYGEPVLKNRKKWLKKTIISAHPGWLCIKCEVHADCDELFVSFFVKQTVLCGFGTTTSQLTLFRYKDRIADETSPSLGSTGCQLGTTGSPQT
ncbi:hypothetical protein, partial [Aeromonas jandaei]|uniref:hypothetical protein n=1 Tax=Aeromonas jandaei TaxID=650 RepID=UPI003B9E60E9